MTQLRELLDLPERIHKSQFVVTLEKGVGNPESVAEHYAVTAEIHDAYDRALGLVKSSIFDHQNVASYLHGSFGSGKSHFMALLSLMLADDSRAFAAPELHDLRLKHEWLQGKRVLRLHFNMIDAETLEDRIFKGYLSHLAQHASSAPLPAIFKDAELFENANGLRRDLGDATFFAKLNQGKQNSGKWGKLESAQAWDSVRFEAATQSADPEERARLLTDLTRTHFSAFASGNQGFVPFEAGLSVICAHAKRELKVDALVLFLDELVLWLGSIAADKARLNREVPKLSRLVERNIAGGETPVITFAARQRDIAEMVSDELIGPEHEHLRTALSHWDGRFNEIKLGDKNLPEIVEKRVVRVKDEQARKLLDMSFEKLRGQLRTRAYETLLGNEGDEKAFRKVYPFSPALIETLIALSHLLQRERTALKVLMELLVEHLPVHMPDFQLGEVIPVGELWDVLAAGEEPMDGTHRARFRQAKRLYEHELAPVLKAHPSDRPRADQRLIKTLLLSALVPQVPALRNLTVHRLVQLNHGSLKSAIVPGGEMQKAASLLREWAAQIHNLRIGEGEDPSVHLVLDDIDTSAIIANAQNYNTEGARKGKLREILFDALGLDEKVDAFEHKVVWRGSKRVGSVLYGNIRELDDVQLQAAPDHDFRLLIDYPFDKAGHAPTEDEARVSQFVDSGKQSPTIAWIPSFFGEKVQRALGELVVIDRILEGDNYKQHMSSLREEEQRRARTALEHLSNQKRAQVRKALGVAYGLRAALDAGDSDLDEARSIERHFFSLWPNCRLSTPVKSELSRAVDAAVGELMDERYPRHPHFEPADRAVSTGQLEKGFAAYERVCAHPEQRLPVTKRELDEYALPEVLGLIDLSEANASVRQRFAQEIDKQLAASAVETPTVRQIKNCLDSEHVRGLSDEVADFEVLCYALVSHRELRRDDRAVTDPKLGKLNPDWELVKSPLPTMAEWSAAIARAGELFGIGLSHALNVKNLRLFFDQVQGKVGAATRARAPEVADVLVERCERFGVEGARLTTARAVRLLLEALGTRDPVAQVQALASFEPRTSLAAMRKHIESADATLRMLQDDMRFGAFEALLVSQDPKAAQILADVRQVLERDEVLDPLSSRLNELGLLAQRLLTAGQVKDTPKPGIVAHGDRRNITGDSLQSAFEAIEADAAKALARAGEGARLHVEWKVEKG
jgi:hypothetical protein